VQQLDIDLDDVRHRAAGVADLAARVAGGPAASPPPGVTAPGWAASETLAGWEVAAHRQLDALAATIDHAARRLAAAADGYAAADTRAAARLHAAASWAQP
jgi:hypothetical protein